MLRHIQSPSSAMNIYCSLFLILTTVQICISTDVFIKDDPCSKFDSCHVKPRLRTCSCDLDCHVYGICCQDSDEQRHTISKVPFQCYHQKTIMPLFAKRSCDGDFRGHLGNIRACLEGEIDDMDVSNNRLATSHKTKVTYWNLDCAICNNEAHSDLELWSIEVFCPSLDEVDRRLIRKNLTFDEDSKQWGLVIRGQFLECVVKYTQPPYTDEAKHCVPNLISSCPDDYNNSDIITKCSQYYGERSLKNSNKYYKNVHCAICNGVDVKELKCTGMSGPEDFAEETNFKNMVQEFFTSREWIEKQKGGRFKCSKGFLYDPSWKKCRRFEWKPQSLVAKNSSERNQLGLILLLILLLFLR